jgi:hypothetical protein
MGRRQMGIDWAVMFPRKGADPAELRRLIRQQAEAFQAMPSYWDRDFMTPRSALDRTKEEHEPLFSKSCRALMELLELPEYGDETGRLTEFPGLPPCWRVYPIMDSPIFPPQWRLQAFRRFLPNELGRQLEEWRGWLSTVDRGEYRDYLFEALCPRDDEQVVPRLARRRGSRFEDGTAGAERASSRALPRIPAPAGSRDRAGTDPPISDETRRTRRSTADPGGAEILARAKAWDATLRDWRSSIQKQGWRPVCLGEDILSFDHYLALTRDCSLLEFLAWAEKRRLFGMGWVLN